MPELILDLQTSRLDFGNSAGYARPPFASHIETMATTYMQLTQQIKTLQAQAEIVKKKEMGEVIARIKEAISVYSLTAQELGFGAGSGAQSKSAARRPAAAAGRRKSSKANRPAVAYQDGAGNTWGGRGPRPAWLRTALQGGAELASFAIGSMPPAPPVASVEGEGEGEVAEMPGMPAAPAKKARAVSRKATKAAKAEKAPAAVKYKDDAGHTWSGFGPKPGWFKDALAAGKTLKELAAA